MSVELRFFEAFDQVTKRFDTVEQAVLYFRKHRNSRNKNVKKHLVNWFGGEYRIKMGEKTWSDWYKIS